MFCRIENKKAVRKLVTIVSVIMIGFGFVSIWKEKQQEKQINDLFIDSLCKARSGFCVRYENEEIKTFYYTETASNLNTCVNLMQFRPLSNCKNRNELFNTVYYLYLCMTKPNSREVITKDKEYLVAEYLTKIIQDINDQESCKVLSKIAGDLYFKK